MEVGKFLNRNWIFAPALINSRLFSLTMHLGFICGFISIDILKLHKTRLERKLRSISLDFCYRSLVIIIYAMTILDYYASVSNVLLSLKLSDLILHSTAGVLLYTSDMSKRIYWLRNQGTLFKIFKNILTEHDAHQKQFTNSGKVNMT